MNNAWITHKSPLISYILFGVAVLSFLSYPVLRAVSHGEVGNAALVCSFAIGLAWQVLTVYLHPQRVLPWILLGVYVFACALFIFAISA